MKSAHHSLIVAAVLARGISAAPQYEIDASFQTQIGGTVHAIAPLAGGAMLVGGEFDSVTGISTTNLVRLNRYGRLDATLDAAPNSGVYAISLASDGSAYVGGSFNLPARNLFRLSADGSMDRNLHFGACTSGRITSLALDGEGGVLLGGPFRQLDGLPARYVARMAATGGGDTNFSCGLNPSYALEAGVMAMAVQPDGKILVSGNFNIGNEAACLVRLLSDGSIDESFGGNPGPMLYPKTVVLQPDGRIIVGGTESSNGGGFVRRLNSDGSIDASFQNVTFAGSVNSVALGRDGTVLAGGNFPEKLARLHADGARDLSWDIHPDGSVQTIATLEDGSVLIGGAFREVAGTEHQGIARLRVKSGGQQAFATNVNGRFVARLAGTVGRVYRIEASADLRSWVSLGNVAATSDGIEITDELANARFSRFFRARLME